MTISTQQYAKALYEFIHDRDTKELDNRILAFARFLKDERQLKKKDMIIALYEQYAKEQEGEMDIEIISAHHPEEKIIAQIKKTFGTSGDAMIKSDNTLIGGVRIRKGNTIFDASIRTQLETLHRELTHVS